MNICKACPLYKKLAVGAICNNKLWINPNTNETSPQPMIGYFKGCGCVLGSKWKGTNSHCPAGKW